MRRGEIWWVALPTPIGSEPGLRRPVLVVQSNEFNASRINTVVVAAITSNLKLADAPGNVLITRKVSKLPADSVVNVSQLATVDKSSLINRVGTLPSDVLQQVSDGLRLVLAI